jgi:hypothetical protein
MMQWASVYLQGAGLLVQPAEWQVITFLPSVGNLSFLFFGGVLRSFLLSVTVESAGPPCSLGRQASWCQKLV